MRTIEDSAMKTETVDLKEAETHLAELVHRAISGVHVVLSENDKPVARIVPLKRRVAGLHAGEVWTSDDFDEPLALAAPIRPVRLS